MLKAKAISWNTTLPIIALLAILVAACAPGIQPAAPKVKDKVSVRLGWKAAGQFAPTIVAKAKGFFDEEGLDVEVNEGTGSYAVVQAINANSDTFGIVTADAVALGVQQGMTVRSLASIVQKSPSGIAYRKDDGIQKPKDFEGKTLGLPEALATSKQIQLFLKLQGADMNKVTVLNLDPAVVYQSWLSKRIHGYGAFINDTYVPAQMDEPNAQLMLLADYGLNVLNLGIAATTQTIQNQPDMVRRFVRANLRGAKFSKEQIDESADIIVQAYPALRKEVVREQVRRTGDLMESAATKQGGLGYQGKADWEETDKVLADIGLLKQRAPNVETYYTNDFLK